MTLAVERGVKLKLFLNSFSALENHNIFHKHFSFKETISYMCAL